MRREMANLLKAPAPPQGGGGGTAGAQGSKERQLALRDAGATSPAAAETSYYDVLGVDRSASPEDINAAYKAKVRESHPDKNRDDPEAKEKFQKLNEANAVLSDPKKKAEYDRKTVSDID